MATRFVHTLFTVKGGMFAQGHWLAKLTCHSEGGNSSSWQLMCWSEYISLVLSPVFFFSSACRFVQVFTWRCLAIPPDPPLPELGSGTSDAPPRCVFHCPVCIPRVDWWAVWTLWWSGNTRWWSVALLLWFWLMTGPAGCWHRCDSLVRQRDFSSGVVFQCRLFYSICKAPVCRCMHQHMC